ncbi:hypothetical protein J2T56_001370 [Natronobacillus azotifigens]|uniref:Uncharacterized protein n=1 Tax=Natronobacillus azotifigens TaxID=472978 RepID=A0A9J6RCH6_9BACI|nr:hypothetical protein [Natronobacillus azotifigens]MCZ0703062.1 hypothetical protein [Natronobacillus azotifigens]
MNEYTKPNVTLPVSLHDAIITKVIVEKSSTALFNDLLLFEFEDGFFKVGEKEVYKTRKSTIKISGVDFDFSHVYYCEGNRRIEVDFDRFSKDVNENAYEIIDETYGYNKTKFSGELLLKDRRVEVQVSLYHLHAAVYRWQVE